MMVRQVTMYGHVTEHCHMESVSIKDSSKEAVCEARNLRVGDTSIHDLSMAVLSRHWRCSAAVRWGARRKFVLLCGFPVCVMHHNFSSSKTKRH
jgi:hypothetical protein